VDEDGSQVISNMRARAEQCRRLAAALTDKPAADVLLKMAGEVESDIARLEGTAEMPIPMPPSAEG